MNQDDLILSDIVNDSLRKLTKGSGVIFAGTVIGMVLFYISRVLIGRLFTPAEYGIFSLGTMFVGFFTLISLLGLQEGVSRQIAYYLGRGDFRKVRRVIFSSIRTVLLISIIISAILFLLSGIISIKIFHNPSFSEPFRIFIISIPAFSLIYILTSISRGFDRTRERVYFQNILNGSLFLLFLIFIAVFKLTSNAVVYAFVLSTVITSLAFWVYVRKESFYLSGKFKNSLFGFSLNLIDRKLLFFSLPLLGISLLDNISSWIDSLMLGYLKNTELVGIYNGALPLARFIPSILGATAFIYLPVITKLYSQNMEKEAKRVYAVLTKWVFFLTLPFFLLLFLFPEAVLVNSFGVNYVGAKLPLQILALGFLVHVFFGLNGGTLLALGETRFLMWTSLFATVSGAFLNWLLIPSLGIVGAAASTAFVVLIFKLIRSGKLYFSYRIHPFTRNYLKPTFLMMIVCLIFYVMTKGAKIGWWLLPLFFILFLGLSFLSILLTKSVDSEEISILVILAEKIGINPLLIKAVLQKFT
jgi:O-antigen/teichoic acid export membrane protein